MSHGRGGDRGRTWVSPKEAAGDLGYSIGTVRALIADGTLGAAQRKRGAQIRIPQASVLALKDKLEGGGE